MVAESHDGAGETLDAVELAGQARTFDLVEATVGAPTPQPRTTTDAPPPDISRSPETAISRSLTDSGDSWAAHDSPGRWAHESAVSLSRLGDLDAAEEHLHLALEFPVWTGDALAPSFSPTWAASSP
ncbi:hypothetical protein RB628_00170 [Streptomyces sp. ADMS]|uniref:hypothetical protein n=1 Tax=Streptomyces sp. ADMS TaxID=3071415 RepID=UPI00296FDD90|nr:hypothetical protein [Streptomyces sp. ADMS]MDW4903799.1 hypothetical protein [Streptomyces sp. ADMS]